jgi:hypothetical protein
MTALLRDLLLALILACAPAVPALAWGATGHELVSGVGAELLPDEVPAFLRTPEAIAEITVLGRELDRSKGAGETHDRERDPGHWVSLDDAGLVMGAMPLDALPATREAYDTTLRAKGVTQYGAGYLPLAIVDGWQQLVKDFAYWRAASVGARSAADPADRAWFDTDRQRRERLLIRDLGVWSHYIGDASQPLHVSIHFDGWGPYDNPRSFTTKRGIHAQFEGPFVRANVQRDKVKAAAAPYRDCGGCPVQERARALILASHALVVPFYELEKRSAFVDGNEAGTAFATERLAQSAAVMRDMVVDAWRASADMGVGYPMIGVRDIEAGRHVLTRDDFGRD